MSQQDSLLQLHTKIANIAPYPLRTITKQGSLIKAESKNAYRYLEISLEATSVLMWFFKWFVAPDFIRTLDPIPTRRVRVRLFRFPLLFGLVKFEMFLQTTQRHSFILIIRGWPVSKVLERISFVEFWDRHGISRPIRWRISLHALQDGLMHMCSNRNISGAAPVQGECNIGPVAFDDFPTLVER